ncbi:MAG: hypothetical protein ACOCVM_04405 [Desulfovibrionaceae bacterium]
MSQYEKLSESLSDEVMTDMAEGFFGARRALEDDLDLFHAMVGLLRERKEGVLARYALLRRLLLDEKEAAALFRELGVDPELLPASETLPGPRRCFKPPWGLGFARRYAKTLFLAYGCFQEELEAYRHGRWEEDPGQKGRKRRSVNLEQLREILQAINKRIETLNTSCSPVCMLQYIKEMDPAQLERERIAGASFAGYACSLDEHLAFEPLRFEDLELLEFFDAPEPKEAGSAVKAAGRRLARERPEDARRALEEARIARPTAGADEK